MLDERVAADEPVGTNAHPIERDCTDGVSVAGDGTVCATCNLSWPREIDSAANTAPPSLEAAAAAAPPGAGPTASIDDRYLEPL